MAPNSQVASATEALHINLPASTEILSTLSPTPVPFGAHFACWPIKLLEKGNDIKGSIIFSSLSKNETSFAWDVSSFSTSKLDYHSDAYSVSLDGSLLATTLTSENKVILVSTFETKVFPLNQPLSDGKVYLGATFLPSGKVAIEVHSEEEDSIFYTPPQSGYKVEYYLLDPNTGGMTYNSVLLPGFTLGTQLARFPIRFSPDRQFVIYKTTPLENGVVNYALMNVHTGQILWTGSSMPYWKPDGNSLSYLLGQGEKDSQGYFLYNNLFSLLKDGQSTQLTWFDRTMLVEPGKLFSQNPWSPNSRYAVFFGTSNKTLPTFLLYIWDNQEKIAYRPCLPDELRAYSNYFVHWSFDGNHLLIRLVYPDSLPIGDLPPHTHYLDLILDMTNQIIYTLPDEKERLLQYELLAPDGAKIVDWVNWEIP